MTNENYIYCRKSITAAGEACDYTDHSVGRGLDGAVKLECGKLISLTYITGSKLMIKRRTKLGRKYAPQNVKNNDYKRWRSKHLITHGKNRAMRWNSKQRHTNRKIIMQVRGKNKR